MTRKRSDRPDKADQSHEEPPRVVRIWSELDGPDDIEQVARRAAAEQPPPMLTAS